LINQTEGKSINFEVETEFCDEVLPPNWLENLNKPMFNYDYSAILNQNFTENFKIKHPLEKKMILKKALSNVLEENGSLFLDNLKGLENKIQTPKKNSLTSPKIEKQNSENLPSNALKKVSIDGMSAFGFDLDLDTNEKVDI